MAARWMGDIDAAPASRAIDRVKVVGRGRGDVDALDIYCTCLAGPMELQVCREGRRKQHRSCSRSEISLPLPQHGRLFNSGAWGALTQHVRSSPPPLPAPHPSCYS